MDNASSIIVLSHGPVVPLLGMNETSTTLARRMTKMLMVTVPPKTKRGNLSVRHPPGTRMRTPRAALRRRRRRPRRMIVPA